MVPLVWGIVKALSQLGGLSLLSSLAEFQAYVLYCALSVQL